MPRALIVSKAMARATEKIAVVRFTMFLRFGVALDESCSSTPLISLTAAIPKLDSLFFLSGKRVVRSPKLSR
jgi:hypothetical protein